MKIIMYFSSGDKFIGDLLPPRKERETQTELEERITKEFNSSQPLCVNKVTKCKILRN